jgi:hypothetical protein
MEAGGIEPPSRDVSERASTCIVGHLSFAADDSDRQDSSLASSTVFSPISGRAAEINQPAVVAQHH